MNAKLVEITEVIRLYEQHAPDGCAARSTVNKWIAARRIPYTRLSRKHRLFDRRAVLAALGGSFAHQEEFLSVADAFRLARRPYPKPRGKQPQSEPNEK